MTRLGHLRPLTQPGGDKAAHEPWRMAVALLHAANLTSEAHRLFGSRPAFAAVLAQLDHPSPRASTRSTSLGRVFDGVAALLGVHTDHQFEGQAAMKLESLCRAPRPHPDGFLISDELTLDLLPLLPALLNTTPSDAADLFHGTLIAALTEWLERASRQTGLTTVALGGGCVLNGRLLTGLLASTERLGLTLLIPRELPPGDGAISLGQAWIGASHLF
jgi:hydrogenase maturation protein HypF